MDLEAIKTMNHDEIMARKAELKTTLNALLEDENADLTEIETEINALNERDSEIAEKAQKRQALLEAVAVGNEGKVVGKTNMENVRATMEYRKAFMNYVQNGKVSDILVFQRNNDQVESTDLGVLLPETIVQSIMTGLEKKYGQLYDKVRKTNIKGGVKYPIGSFEATFRRITELTVSERQAVGGVTDYVQFTYNIGEIRIAKTLLQQVLTVPAFEQKVAETIIKAYRKAMDKEIMTGDASNNEMEGILTEAAKTQSRIPSANIIEFTEKEMADWKSWQKKLFAVIPLSLRGEGFEFVMTPHTYESNIKTLADDNNRPVYAETYNPIDGTEVARFKGKEVTFVEDDILKNFDDATNGQYFGMYWVPQNAYAINSNMQFNVVHYFDHETNQYVDKALVINDGKVLDPKYLYLLKKKVSG
jgi:HK97 family phage major capsid protein